MYGTYSEMSSPADCPREDGGMSTSPSQSCDLDFATSPTMATSPIRAFSPRPPTPPPDGDDILDSIDGSPRPSTSPQKMASNPPDFGFAKRFGSRMALSPQHIAFETETETERELHPMHPSRLKLPKLPGFVVNRRQSQRRNGEEETLSQLRKQGIVGQARSNLRPLAEDQVGRLEQLRQEQLAKFRLDNVGRDLIGTRGSTPYPHNYTRDTRHNFNVDYLFGAHANVKPTTTLTVEEMDAKYERHKERQRVVLMSVRERGTRRRRLVDRVGIPFYCDADDSQEAHPRDSGKDRRKARRREKPHERLSAVKQKRESPSRSGTMTESREEHESRDSRKTRRKN